MEPREIVHRVLSIGRVAGAEVQPVREIEHLATPEQHVFAQSKHSSGGFFSVLLLLLCGVLAVENACAGGYLVVDSKGGIYPFGDAVSHGSLAGISLNKPIVGMEATSGEHGYWLVASDGGIFSFGNARFYGSTGGITLTHPIVGMATRPDGLGYWLVASDGGIFAFGNAGFYGSTGGITLAHPIVGMATTPDGLGYWLVASDGGIFSFGDAHYYGSTGGVTLRNPIVGMAATPAGLGYWLVASDGGIFAFGNAGFYGSTGGVTLTHPIVGMAVTPGGRGYWLLDEDGGIFAFGDAAWYGAPTAAINVATNPAVAIVSIPTPPPLNLTLGISGGNNLTLSLRDTDGTAILAYRVPQISVLASTNLVVAISDWQKVTNTLVLSPDGVASVQGLSLSNAPNRFFRAEETP